MYRSKRVYGIVMVVVMVLLLTVSAYAGTMMTRGETLAVGELVKLGAANALYKTTGASDTPLGVVTNINVRGDATQVNIVNTDEAFISIDEAITAGEFISPSGGTAGTVVGEAAMQTNSFGVAVENSADGQVLVRFVSLNSGAGGFAPATARYVVTEATGDLSNEEVHPNTGNPNYDVKHEASDVSDFDAEVSNNTDVAANTSARHASASDNQNLFATIDASSGTDPVVDSQTDTLVVAGSNGITVTGDSAADSITIAPTYGSSTSTIAQGDDSRFHTQGTDQGLDTGGANSVTAAEAEAGYDHSVGDGTDHGLSAADVSAIGDAANQVDDTHIDWGAGANQVDIADIPGGAAADDYLWNFAAINMSDNAEGIRIPQATDCSASTLDGQMCYDTDNNILYMGDGLVAQPIGGGASQLDQLHIDYVVPADAESLFAAADIEINVAALAADSMVHGVDIAATGITTGSVAAIGVHGNIDVLHQHLTTFATPDQSTPDAYAGEIPSGGSWSDGIHATLFEADNDEIYIGALAKFDTIQVTLTTAASVTEELIFEYQHTDTTWDPFIPIDGTNNFQNLQGTIIMNSSDFTWDDDADPGGGDSAAGYWIRIRRTRNNVVVDPVASLIQIAQSSMYMWNGDGEVTMAKVTPAEIILPSGNDGTVVATTGEVLLDLDGNTEGKNNLTSTTLLAYNAVAQVYFFSISEVEIDNMADNDAFIYDAGTKSILTEQPPGAPGGADTQVQYNNSGSFGGDSDWTYDGTLNHMLLQNGLLAAEETVRIYRVGSLDYSWDIKAPSGLAADYILTLPLNDGDSGQVLETDGDGVTSWSTPAGGGDVLTTDIDEFAEVQALVADKTLVNEEDAATWDALGTFSAGVVVADNFKMPTGTDEDVDALGEMTYDQDDTTLRVYDGYRQVALAQAQGPKVMFTIASPLDLVDAATTAVFRNMTGLALTITDIYSSSDTDDVVFTLKETAGDDFTSLTTIEAVTISVDGTGVYKGDVAEGDIDHNVIESGNWIVFDNDAADDPDWVQVILRGCYDADVN